jgi:hypothetical protein
MPRIASPELVAAVTGERDGDPLARRRGNVVRRHCRRIAEWLIEVPGETWQQLFHVRPDERRLESAAKVPCDSRRLLDLVVLPVREPDGRRENLRVARLRHVRDNGR